MKAKSPIKPSKLYWDDLNEGQNYVYGEYLVTEYELTQFAYKYDPLDFHIDAHKSKNTPFGTLIASGIHTLAINQRLSVNHVYKNWHLIAGKSMSNCRFIRPVHPNDVLTVNLTIKKLIKSNRPDRGVVELKFIVINQINLPVLKVDGEVLLLRKPPSSIQLKQDKDTI
ncbi:hypothetical protein A9Q81_03560 [Gammaproteobacteria bacterium 42_54_T18]|nr:hypothetical protein A9Q81_03560 [Gammaproteobacteria bacterium 42_54_T18]